jgi:hypothetical protein
MDFERLLISPKTPTSRKRMQIQKELIQIYRTARKANNIPSAIKALEVLARELGLLYGQKKRLEGLTLKDLSDEELRGLLRDDTKATPKADSENAMQTISTKID